MNIIFSTNQIDKKYINSLSYFSNKNNIDFLSFVDKKNVFYDGYLPGQKKLNFAFYSEDLSDILELDGNLKDLQYIDSDIDFV